MHGPGDDARSAPERDFHVNGIVAPPPVYAQAFALSARGSILPMQVV
jgi:hypothetical protein